MKWHAYNTILIACPFCGKQISVEFKPKMPTTRTSSSAAAGQKQSRFIEQEKYIAKDCPHCGVSGDRIEKALRDASSTYEPKTKSKDELRMELDALGLGGRFAGRRR
jgi:sarcosine oxidase delta subunit